MRNDVVLSTPAMGSPTYATPACGPSTVLMRTGTDTTRQSVDSLPPLPDVVNGSSPRATDSVTDSSGSTGVPYRSFVCGQTCGE